MKIFCILQALEIQFHLLQNKKKVITLHDYFDILSIRNLKILR